MEPVVIVVIAWLALAATDATAKLWLIATAVTYAIVSIIAAVPAYTDGASASAFLTSLLGNLLVIAGVALVIRRQPLPTERISL